MSRRCATCHAYLEGNEVACPSCGGVFCPPHQSWPPGMKRLVGLLSLADATETLRTDQERYERLLQNTIKGRAYGNTLVRWSALPIDCFTVMLQLLDAWERAGCPTDFESLITLRRRLALGAAA